MTRLATPGENSCELTYIFMMPIILSKLRFKSILPLVLGFACLIFSNRPVAAVDTDAAAQLAPAETTPAAPEGPAPIPESQIIKSEEDIAREKAIAEFTQRMKDSNYPELFEKAGNEFGVPPDVLKGIAFAETRWEHLKWPPGETVSPENGMPRPYGIMSLWDNDYFGHSLLEAAKLIGKDPQELKDDPYQNMRGAAALLKKLYQETPKPADAQGDEIESWRKAIVKYCGIPQPELSEQHALEVYEWMNQGYHEYGIEWDDHPVKLDAMRAEVAKIKAEAQAKVEAQMKEEEEKEKESHVPGVPVVKPASKAAPVEVKTVVATTTSPQHTASQSKQRWILIGAIFLLLAVGAIYMLTRKSEEAPRK